MNTNYEIAYHRQLVDELLSNPVPFPKGRFNGKGIVICGGGVSYFTCTWVCVNMLRYQGCDLPIELWYLGPQELDEEMEALIRPFGVTCIDALEMIKHYPVKNLISWELKPYAILHSRFEEVLYIDADNMPLRNPDFLFSSEAYLETGSIFWPDRYRGQGEGEPWLRREAWSICQIPFRDESEFETGQLVVDKRKCWDPLVLTMHYNEHSEFYYAFFYGDKDTFHLAWRKLGYPYLLMPYANKSLGNDAAIVQYDFEGEPLFQHRNGDKWSLHYKNTKLAGFRLEEKGFAFLDILRNQWNGQIEKGASTFSLAEQAAFSEIVSTKTYECTIEGIGTWWMELLWDFKVIEPQTMNKSWAVQSNGKDGAVLTLKFNNIYGHSCRLWPKGKGVWRGRWMTKERQAIEIKPKQNPVTKSAIRKYQRLQKEFINHIPPYPEERFRGAGIVMVGGGPKYFPGVWVCINLLRRQLGCRLPIELWYLGSNEVDTFLMELLEPLDVRCIDAFEVRKKYPVRILNGWESKPYAILNSRFEEVVFIDADNVPVKNPTFLLESEAYRSTGSIFWPDYGRLGSFQNIWQICGIPHRDEPEFETGQIVLNKKKVWKALQLTMHYNEHSDFYYKYINGDKETFHMAWRKLDLQYAMTNFPLQPLEETMCQYDFDGEVIFQHRNLDKWRLDGKNKRIEGFLFEELCLSYLKELSALWEPSIKE